MSPFYFAVYVSPFSSSSSTCFSSLSLYRAQFDSCVFLAETFANVYSQYAHLLFVRIKIVMIWLFPVGFRNSCTAHFVTYHTLLEPTENFATNSVIAHASKSNRQIVYFVARMLALKDNIFKGIRWNVEIFTVAAVKSIADAEMCMKFNHRNSIKYWRIHFRFWCEYCETKQRRFPSNVGIYRYLLRHC